MRIYTLDILPVAVVHLPPYIFHPYLTQYISYGKCNNFQETP